MGIGIKIVNTAGSTIIDETYSNYYLRAKGTANVSQSHVSNSSDIAVGGMVDVTVTATTPLFAIKADSYAAIFSTKRNGDGTWTFRVITAATSGTVAWYLFDIPANAAHSSYGIRVFNLYGIKVFDSGYAYARIAADKTKNDGFGAETLGLTAGRTYAVAQAAAALMTTIADGGSGWSTVAWKYYGARGGNGSVEFGSFDSYVWRLMIDPAALGPYVKQDYRALIFDVTNF